MDVGNAISELTERIEIWDGYNRTHPSGEIGLSWRDVMAFCKAALEEREKNRAYLEKVKADLKALNPGDTLTVAVVEEMLEGFMLGGAD